MYPEIHFHSWSLSTYFLTISLTFCLMFLYLRRRAHRFGFSVVDILDLAMLTTVFGFLGARLFFVFYESPQYFFEHPLSIFSFWEGGFVFFGGLFSALVAGFIYLKWKKIPVLSTLNLMAPVLALGYSLGRLACFFQGCCYGKPTHSPLGLHFTPLIDAGETVARYPTQLFASFGELIVFLLILFLEKYGHKKNKFMSNSLFFIWMMGHGLNRMIMEIFRDDPRGPLIGGMGISFWIALGLTSTGFFLLWKQRRSSNL